MLFMAKAWNHSRTSSVSNSPILSRGKSALNTRNGRPEMSMTTRDSVSSMGMCTLKIAGDARHVAERLLDRLAKRDAGVFGGMVIINVQVANRLDREVDAGMAGEEIEHMVEKADAGRDIGHAGTIEVHGDLDVGFLGLALDRRGAH